MGLPSVIEIVPMTGAVTARITVPGSKSITNRALVLAALGDGETTLRGALWSEDTQVMTACLEELGFMVQVAPDPDERGNRIITVYGQGGAIRPGGTEERPLELFVGNAGTAARFLAALVCLGSGVYRLHGVPRMHERPQAALFMALRELGYRVEATADKLPARIFGGGPLGGSCRVSIAQSSQFASALLLCAGRGGWRVDVTGENAEESPYVAMTAKLMERLPAGGGTLRIEPDASSGSYFWAASHLAAIGAPGTEAFAAASEKAVPSSRIEVADWPETGWQMDEAFPRFLVPPNRVSRRTDLGDSIMTAIVMASLGEHPVAFTDLGRLRVQECERVRALRTELTKCGVEVLEHGDTLTVMPAPERIHGAEIETYEDHRMAMCFSILGLKVPGIRIQNPACVKKTFPNFYQKLAGPPPAGLGVVILDGASRGPLVGEALLAGEEES